MNKKLGFTPIQLGFTLLEVIIASAVSLIIGALLTSILVNNIGVFYQERSNVDSGVNLNNALSLINGELLQGASVAVGYPEATPIYTTSESTLVLKVPTVGINGVIANTFDYTVIFQDPLESNILRKKTFVDLQSSKLVEDKVITSAMEAITFAYLDSQDNIVTPVMASRIKTNLKVVSSTGIISSNQQSTIITTLRNPL